MSYRILLKKRRRFWQTIFPIKLCSNAYFTGQTDHPYLTQRLCEESVKTVLQLKTPSENCSAIDRLCNELFFSAEERKSEKNLAFVAKRILESPLDRAALIDLFRKVRPRAVHNDEKDALQSTLRLSGAARAHKGRLLVRNRIYVRVFDSSWIRENMPDAERRRQRSTALRIALAVGCIAAVIVGAMGWLTFRANKAEQMAKMKTIQAQESADKASRLYYIANMNLCLAAWDSNNISRVLELFEDTLDIPLQGFEWGHWNRMCHLDLFTLKGHTDQVTSNSFSPDGRRIVTGSMDETAKVLETKFD